MKHEAIKLLEQALAMMKAQDSVDEPFKFIPGEFVQVSNDGNDWWVRIFDNYDPDRNYPYWAHDSDRLLKCSWKYCRLPKDVPNILIRFPGSECPVGENVLVVAFSNDTRLFMDAAKRIYWERVTHYMIFDLPTK